MDEQLSNILLQDRKYEVKPDFSSFDNSYKENQLFKEKDENQQKKLQKVQSMQNYDHSDQNFNIHNDQSEQTSYQLQRQGIGLGNVNYNNLPKTLTGCCLTAIQQVGGKTMKRKYQTQIESSIWYRQNILTLLLKFCDQQNNYKLLLYFIKKNIIQRLKRNRIKTQAKNQKKSSLALAYVHIYSQLISWIKQKGPMVPGLLEENNNGNDEMEEQIIGSLMNIVFKSSVGKDNDKNQCKLRVNSLIKQMRKNRHYTKYITLQ